jgi:hypothetical protein
MSVIRFSSLLCALALAACSADANRSAPGATDSGAHPDAGADAHDDSGAPDDTSIVEDSASEVPEDDAADTSEVVDAGPLFGEPCGESTGLAFTPGLQFSGSVSFVRDDPKSPGSHQRVSISAPIFPQVLVLYSGEGSGYPTTDAALVKLAHDSALTFCFLIGDCAKSDSAIHTTPPLTASEISTNYDHVAECAYTKYTAKPYWIPQLVSDVDICGREIGPGWSLITEADLESFKDSDLSFVQSTLTTTSGASFYFSLQVFTRATDGSIAQGSLAPGVSPRVTPFPPGTDLKLHYEGGLALRCIKTAPAP